MDPAGRVEEPRPSLRFRSEEVVTHYRGLGRALHAAARVCLALSSLCAVALLLAPSAGGVLHALVRLTFQGTLLSAPFLWFAGWFAARVVLRRADDVALDPEGLTLGSGGDAWRLSREDLADGLAVPAPLERWSVMLTRRSGDVVTLGAPDERTAERVLTELGLGPSQRRVTLRRRRGLARLALGATSVALVSALWLVLEWCLGGVGWDPEDLAVLWALGVSFATSSVLARHGWSEVTVGVDGVGVREGGASRFHSYEDLEGVDLASGGSLALTLRDGARVTVPASPWLRGALARRILQAREAWRSERALTDAPRGLLSRQGRSLSAWRGALRAVVQRAAGYRDATLTHEQVAALLASPSLPGEQRVAAAMALMDAGEPEAPTRIRVAAEACADPPVRVALERIAEGEPEDRAVEAVVAKR